MTTLRGVRLPRLDGSVKGNRRLAREARTLEAMVRVYCHGQHGDGEDLCPACRELLVYARRRLERCPFGEGKTTCARCPVHCYKPDMRGRIRAVMRYAGPRMLWRHPLLALQHLLDGRRKVPMRPQPSGTPTPSQGERHGAQQRGGARATTQVGDQPLALDD